MTDSLFPELSGLDTESQMLQGRMSLMRTEVSPEAVEEEIIKRKRFRTRLKERKAELMRKQNQIRDLAKLLEIIDDHQSDDIAELTAKKWELVNERKENRFNGNSGVSQ